MLDWLMNPDAEKGVYLADEADGWEYRSYAQVSGMARQIAAILHDAGLRPGGRVCVVQPTEYLAVASIYGVWAAGGTVTLGVPPGFGDGHEYIVRTSTVLAAADPQLVVTSTSLAEVVSEAVSRAELTVRPLVLDGASVTGARTLGSLAEAAETALLQFTSGSSGMPKGVQVSWDNLRHNISQISATFGWRRGGNCASWLPLFHDMGLVGALFTTVTNQGDLYLMRPDQFVRDPRRWLNALTYAQHAAMPSFALGYIAKRLGHAGIAELDLSGVRTLVVGAEPVGAGNLAAFADLTRSAGFAASALRPAYGLAEATLIVSAPVLDQPARLARIDTSTLRYGEAIRVHAVEEFTGTQPSGSGWLVGLGTPRDGMSVRVLDADGQPVPEGVLGEVAVCGESVACGYLLDEDRVEDSGSTRFIDGELRSGDAGFLLDGELFLLGRMGSALKVRGRAVFMEDVEAKVARGTGLAANQFAAVAVTDPESTGITLFAEQKPGDWIAEARRIIHSEIGPASTVNVVTGHRGLIRRTSSGKPRRQHLWELWNSGDLGANADIHAPDVTSREVTVARTLLLSREFIEQLLRNTAEIVTIPREAAVFLEGSIAEGFGNAGSDIDFLVVTPGEDMTPTMPTILFVDGRRVEVRTRSTAQMMQQLRQAADCDGDPNRADKDVLNRVQRFLQAVPLRSGEVALDELHGILTYARFCELMRAWWTTRAEQSLRQAVALARLDSCPEALGWARDGLMQAAKAWVAGCGEGYLETKWLVPQLNRLDDTEYTDRYLNLYAATADEDADPALLPEILALAAELGVVVPDDPSMVLLRRIPKVTSWLIGEQVHVVRADTDIFVLSAQAAAVWRSIVFGRSVAEVLARAPGNGRALAEFVYLGLVGLKWRGAGPILPSYAMCDQSKPHTPMPCGLAPALRLTGANGYRDQPLSLSPLPARRFVESAMNMIWSNIVLENAREDLVGAVRNRQADVADVAAHRLLVAATRMLVSSFGVSPLPADVAPRTTVTRLIPRELDNRDRMLELVSAAQRTRFSEVLATEDDGSEALEVLDTMVEEIRTVLDAEFPVTFDSGAQWRKTLALSYDWLRLGGYLNADLPIDEARDLLTSGGVQPHLSEGSSEGDGNPERRQREDRSRSVRDHRLDSTDQGDRSRTGL